MSLTKQQIAEGIYDWFFVKGNKQARRGLSETDKRCMYRGPNGTKCAVGCLIPDEMYLTDMEQVGSVYQIFSTYSKLADYFGTENLNFLSQCQRWHDRYFTTNTSKNYIKETFAKNGIDITNMPLLTQERN